MPLSDDTGRAGTEANIRELVKNGYPQRQAVAIAFSHRKQLLKKRKR